ncbi:MAG: hypothetical protein GVX90_05925, partial [Alphaproteobacteria bacterium]|nr:hypothetical protein [Alphaproteobacteria bacterium]
MTNARARLMLGCGGAALALSLAPAAAPALTPEAAWRSWQDAAGDAGVALEVGG